MVATLPEWGVVRLLAVDTGEVKERPMAGHDAPPSWDEWGTGHNWRLTSLALALGLVEDLQDAIDRGRMRGRSVEVVIRDAEQAEHV